MRLQGSSLGEILHADGLTGCASAVILHHKKVTRELSILPGSLFDSRTVAASLCPLLSPVSKIQSTKQGVRYAKRGLVQDDGPAIRVPFNQRILICSNHQRVYCG